MRGAVSSWEGADAEAVAEPNGPDRRYRAASDRDLTTPWVVWVVWGLMLLGNLALVLGYTSRYPYRDDLHLWCESITPSGSLSITPETVVVRRGLLRYRGDNPHPGLRGHLLVVSREEVVSGRAPGDPAHREAGPRPRRKTWTRRHFC
jgi:hypothetical protein